MSHCDLFSIDTAASFNHKPSLMVNWIVSYKCNLDCSYCSQHDNSADPVPLSDCLSSLKFIFEYADLLFSIKRPHERRLALNLIGGEPMLHPDIVVILETMHKEYAEKYKDRWSLSVCVTTNATIGDNVIEKSVNYVDYWTISYHTESLKKQKEICLKNIKTLHTAGKKLEVRVMAPNDPVLFDEAEIVNRELLQEGVTSLLKPVTGVEYKKENSNTFKIFWKGQLSDSAQEYSTARGITCCSERPLIANSNRKEQINFIPVNNFKGWYCGVNYNFLAVDQFGNIFHNYSCLVSYNDNTISSIGNIKNYQAVIENLQNKIINKNMPVIICPKDVCHGCGMCAPKATTKEQFDKIMKDHLIDTSILNFEAHSNLIDK